MDDRRFDNLTRAVAVGASRRSVLRGVVAGALSGVAALRGGGAAAACFGAGRRCRHDRQCCSGKCRAGACATCPAGKTACGGGCVDTDTSPAHCGGCGVPCAAGQECDDGRCRCTADRCANGCCDGDDCRPGTTVGACGTGGVACAACDDGNECTLDSCENQTCVATPQSGTTCGDEGDRVCCLGSCCAPGQRCLPGTGCFTTCFVAGTRVAMADGTSKPIESIAPGDLVLGNGGRINRVVARDPSRLGSRRLYALNDGPYFVTAEHPFLTKEGWKAIDPAATRAENPALDVAVGRLAVGDRMLALAGVAVAAGAGGPRAGEVIEVRQRPVSLRRLDDRGADPTTPVFNLVLDGDHTYFADDFLVHNKL